MYPSVLMQMKYDVFLDTSKSGGNEYKPETAESSTVIQNRITVKTKETYQSFVHISEEVYYKFVNTISSPMNVNSKDMHKQRLGMERLTHLNEKKDEYFNAFRKLSNTRSSYNCS